MKFSAVTANDAATEELREIALKYNISVITARQTPRPRGWYTSPAPRSLEPDVMFIDYLDRIWR